MDMICRWSLLSKKSLPIISLVATSAHFGVQQINLVICKDKEIPQTPS